MTASLVTSISTLEASAAAMLRGIRGASGDWGHLVAAAQTVIGTTQDLAEDPAFDPRLLHGDEGTPLSEAGRILNDASLLSRETRPDASARLALLASVSFAMGGNFPSATACARRAIDHPDLQGPFYSATLGLVYPSAIGRLLQRAAASPATRDLLEAVNAFLLTGSTPDGPDLDRLAIRCTLESDSSFATSLLHSCRVVIRQIRTLGVAAILHRHRAQLPAGLTERLVQSGVRLFMPSQHSAIVDMALLDSSESAIISLPTSTGKTLLAELCLARCLQSTPGVACFVVPYVAIGRQVVSALRTHMPPTVSVDAHFGQYSPERLSLRSGGQRVLVATPERFDGMLRATPELHGMLRSVVIDEGHLVQNGARGVRMEGLVARLRLLQPQTAGIQLILMTAVVANSAALMEWIGARPDRVITGAWRPSVGRIARWGHDGILDWIATTGREGERGALGRRLVPLPFPQVRPDAKWHRRQTQLPLQAENVAYLTELLADLNDGAVLVVSATKPNTRLIAHALANRSSLLDTPGPVVTSLLALLADQHRHLSRLAYALRRRVAYHNGGLPHAVRALIEDAVRAGELDFVCSTTTLAEGVDLPFRTTVLADWIMWDGQGGEPMGSLLFRNIVGRSGRAGRFVEGDTVLVDNPLGELRLTSTPAIRALLQRTLMLKQSMLTSAIWSSNWDAPPALDRIAALESQVLAAIPENPDSADLAMDLVDRLYVSKIGGAEPCRVAVRRALDRFLDATSEPLARAASPIRLTALGLAANLSGFSPSSVREILAFMRVPEVTYETVPLAIEALTRLGALPEQTNVAWRKRLASNKAKFVVKPIDLDRLLHGWIAGTPELALFSDLQLVRKSKRATPLQDWLEGTSETCSWDEAYDGFVSFLGEVLGNYLPWLFRAAEKLAPHSGNAEAASFDWSLAITQLESRSIDPDVLDDSADAAPA